MFLRPLYFALLLISSTLASACKKDAKPITQTQVDFKKEGALYVLDTLNLKEKAHIDIEIADTEYDIQTGLMYRNAMKNQQGMLFVFDDEAPRYFYMKNTKIPLDIIYINAKQHIVSFQKNAKPFDESSLPSNMPAKYVLEINAGLADTWGLNIGDSVAITR